LLVLLALDVEQLRGESAGEHRLAVRVARVFSPEMRRTEERLEQLTGELAGLPELSEAPLASRYGYRSETLLEQETPQWVQLDLGRSQRIDQIVAVPTHIPSLGKRGEGYGFPLRFKIEVADDLEMEGAVTVVDRTAEDVESPGRYPVICRLEPVQGRYLRFTSTRHFPVEEGFIWALEELVVLSGNNSVAEGKARKASNSLDLFPNWSVNRLNDGQSALGMPVSNEKSPSQGYQSALTNDPREEKWLQVDLGRELVIDEIRLLPVEAADFEMMGSQSFPRSWTVALANDPEFSEVTWRHQRASTNLAGYPGRCAIALTGITHRGRYLRLSTQSLWGSDNQVGFALAEVQAYSDGENVALGQAVTARDMADNSESASWAPGFVTDGFTSRHRLIDYPEYLDLIERRGRLVREQELLLTQRDRKVRKTGLAIDYGGGTFGLVAVFGLGWMLVRQRKIRIQSVAQLRDQIARDLHDDIGSNLGGIVLLSEMGSRCSGEAEAREDFATIREAAEESSQSMQDIVWLIQRGHTGLRELLTRMRHSAEVILGEDAVSLTVEPSEFRDRRLSLFFRRHLFFAFKEALNNVRKHAGATAVEVRIEIDDRELSFEVRDDGAGFDPENASEQGHGLDNLQRRAQRLKGSCTVKSSPGAGSRVTFKATLTI